MRLAATSSPPPVIRRRIVPEPIRLVVGPVRVVRLALVLSAVSRPPATSTSARCRWAGSSRSARLEGFVYFPRLRGAARQLSMEFHHRLGEVPRVLTLTFEVERDGSDAPRG